MLDFVKRLKYTSAFLRRDFVHMNLQLLYQCNFRCRICDFWKPRYEDMPKLSAADVRAMVEKLPAPMIVSIGGGEPLLNPELIDIIKILSEKHFPVMICNGWYVTPENAKEMLQAGLHEISVSVDYADPKKHDKQRGMEGAFEKAINALDTLNKCRTSEYQRVHMISVVMDDNLEEIEPLIRLSGEMGITYLLTFYSHNRGKKDRRNADVDISDYLLKLQKKYPHFVAIRSYIERFTDAVQEGGIRPCYGGKNFLNIDCQGNVSRCIDRLEETAGNILTDSFDEIRKSLLQHYQNNDCGNCWTSCRGNFETLMYGKHPIRNLMDSYQVTRSIPLVTTSERV